MGFSRAEHAIPNVKQVRDWKGLFALWRKEAESLGARSQRATRAVDPKNELATCRLCDLQTLCRSTRN